MQGSRRFRPSSYHIALVVSTLVVLSVVQSGSLLQAAIQRVQPHTHRILADAELLTLFVIADLLTGLSYLAISSLLALLVYRTRAAIPFRGTFLAFGLFIIACGLTHLMHVVTLWRPLFWVEGYVKAFTAIVSVSTAVALPALLPRAVSLMESARTAYERKRQLEQLNATLQDELHERARAEAALRETEARQAFLLHLSDTFRSLSDPWAIMTTASTEVGQYLGVAACGYGEVMEDEDRVIIECEYNDGCMPSAGGWHRISDYSADYRTLLRAGQHLYVENVAADPRSPIGGSAATQALQMQAVALVPLHKQQRLVATFYAMHPEPRVWTATERQILQEVAERTWAAIERMRAELALRESEERFAGAFTHASTGMALVLPDGRFLQVNRALCEITGYSAAELIAMAWQQLTHPDDLAADLDQAQRLLAGETRAYQMEKRYLHRDGHVVWVQLSVSLVRDSAGQVRYFIAQVQDINARKQAEAALEESNANMLIAQQVAQFGSWSVSLTTGSVTWSDELYRILGVDPATFVPSPSSIPRMIHPDDRAFVLQAIEQTNASGTPFTLEHRIVRPDGAIRTVLAQSETLYATDGTPERNVGTLLDITERKSLEAQLIYQAFHDPLTGLPNRALFLDRLDHALTRRQETDRLVAVLFLDLDRFKIINDSLGHKCGDDLLRAAAERIRACVRPSDTVARLGGDEFTIVLEDVAHKDVATVVAARILAALEAPFMLDQQEVFTSASIGIALSSAEHASSESLVQAADIAMYQAKADGKARYALFDPALSVDAQERLELETALRYAAERDELRVHYQPIVDLRTRQMVGLEALVRWQHPQHGLVSPAKFIPLAEETGAILSIGRWVLQRACQDVRSWHAAWPQAASLVLSVNLSARQFQYPGLADDICRVLQETDFPPACLKLEITESVAMEDAEATIATLETLRQLGVQLAIDDFGTGYSSLAYLKRFPINTVKIDRSFISDVMTDPNDAAIAAAIIAMAQRLHLRVVAEGIETREQWAFLRQHHCDEGQGYLFSRPLDADAIVHLLRDGTCPVTDPAQVLGRPAPPPHTNGSHGSWTADQTVAARR